MILRRAKGRVKRRFAIRDAASAHICDHEKKGEVATGLLYISPDSKDVRDQNETVPGSLYNLPHAQTVPGQ